MKLNNWNELSFKEKFQTKYKINLSKVLFWYDAIFHCGRNKRKKEALEIKLEAIKKSDKYISIQSNGTIVKLEGLEKLKRALYLEGNNLQISHNVFNMIGREEDKVALVIEPLAENIIITGNVFQ